MTKMKKCICCKEYKEAKKTYFNYRCKKFKKLQPLCKECDNEDKKERLSKIRYHNRFNFTEGVYPEIMPKKYYSEWRKCWVNFKEELSESMFDMHVKTKIPMK